MSNSDPSSSFEGQTGGGLGVVIGQHVGASSSATDSASGSPGGGMYAFEVNKKYTTDDPNLRKIYALMGQENYTDILKLLDGNPSIDVISISDKKKFTLLHKFVFSLSFEWIQFLYNYATIERMHASTAAQPEALSLSSSNNPSADLLLSASRDPAIQEQLTKWVNAQNEEGSTCMHFAALNGDLNTIRFLLSKGADPKLKNRNGLSLFHIAAQGDQPLPMAYFYAMKLNILERDPKQGIALHWACYLGQENSVNFLLSVLPDYVNDADGEGLTPLHLAVISGNARVVKKLLQRGANKLALDNKNKSASDLARENEFMNIDMMLQDSVGFEEYCNIKTPFKPIEKNLKQIGIFTVLFLLVQFAFITLIFPFFDDSYIEFAIWATLIAISMIGFIGAWLTPPGFASGILETPTANQNKKKNIKMDLPTERNTMQERLLDSNNNDNNKNSNELSSSSSQSGATTSASNSQQQQQQIRLETLIQLYLNASEDSRVCVECCIEKPKRSRHCEICKKCVRVYDHHCPWVNNCIGAQNYKYFLTFIFGLWILMIDTIFEFGYNITHEYSSDIPFQHAPFNWYENSSSDTLSMLLIVKYIVSALVLLLVLFFFALHSILCYVQLTNVFQNQTTFERYNSHSEKPLTQQQQQSQETGTPIGQSRESNNNASNRISSSNNQQSGMQRESSNLLGISATPTGQHQLFNNEHASKDSFNSNGQSGGSVNPSIIMSTANQALLATNRFSQRHESEKKKMKKASIRNVYLMCFANAKNGEFDYKPPLFKH